MEKKVIKEEHEVSTNQIGERMAELASKSDEDYVVTAIACRALIRMRGIQNVDEIDDLIVNKSDEMYSQFRDFTNALSEMLNDADK